MVDPAVSGGYSCHVRLATRQVSKRLGDRWAAKPAFGPTRQSAEYREET
jgi:hypothetical protein